MYRQVEKDKAKIEETIAKLDDYKRSALAHTWEKVNVCVPFGHPLVATRTDRRTATSARSLGSYFPATSASCSHPRTARATSRRASRSRSGWVRSGSRA